MTVFSVIFGIYPLAYTIVLSFTPYVIGRPEFVFAGLVNYSIALSNSFFVNSVTTTFIIATSAVSLELVLGLGLAILLSQKFAGVKLVRVALLLPLMTPPIVVGVIWKTLLFPQTGPLSVIFSWVGLTWPDLLATVSGARLAVILMDAWEYTPFVMLIILAGLLTIPRQVIEAAELDGAKAFSMFRRITLPHIAPVIVIAVVFRLLTAAKMFDSVYVLTNGGPVFGTDVISLLVQRTFVFYYQLSYASAVALMFMVIMFALAFFLARAMRRSLR
jgi:multiple sugar transport system permease protein